jgi:hypothetical protein
MTKRNRNIKNLFIMLQRGTNIMANQIKTPIQIYNIEKVLYENLTFEIPTLLFCYQVRPSSNNKTLNARLLARVITGCHYT